MQTYKTVLVKYLEVSIAEYEKSQILLKSEPSPVLGKHVLEWRDTRFSAMVSSFIKLARYELTERRCKNVLFMEPVPLVELYCMESGLSEAISCQLSALIGSLDGLTCRVDPGKNPGNGDAAILVRNAAFGQVQSLAAG